MDSIQARASVDERKKRSVFTRYADETDDVDARDILEWSEAHLHKGHEFSQDEVLMDNPAEGCSWGYCHTCKEQFWLSCWEVDW